MNCKFKNGDRVYHKNLKQYGVFIGYAWETDDEADVEFEEDGYIEQKHVSVCQLELAVTHGCDCCTGDEALYWKDNENCAFIDSHGEIMAVVNDKTMRFKVKRCPNCGREFPNGMEM